MQTLYIYVCVCVCVCVCAGKRDGLIIYTPYSYLTIFGMILHVVMVLWAWSFVNFTLPHSITKIQLGFLFRNIDFLFFTILGYIHIRDTYMWTKLPTFISISDIISYLKSLTIFGIICMFTCRQIKYIKMGFYNKILRLLNVYPFQPYWFQIFGQFQPFDHTYQIITSKLCGIWIKVQTSKQNTDN